MFEIERAGLKRQSGGESDRQVTVRVLGLVARRYVTIMLGNWC
ncbi:hypothetical protein [Bosea sp. PAMC 26642]|nr:hypothetical protein [Bosea sp. PAMC 26642]